MEFTYYRNVNIRGTVNDSTAHAQKHDVRVTSGHIKILVVWVMCYGSGIFGGRDQTGDGQPSYLLYYYFVCMITSGCNQGVADEEEQSGAATNVDIIGKQQLKQQCAMLLE